MNNLQTIPTNDRFIGETPKEKLSLKGYVAERRLVRAILRNAEEVETHLRQRYLFPEVTRMLSQNGRPDRFRSIELLACFLRTLPAQTCIDLFAICEKDGILQAIDEMHKISPLNL